MKEAIVAGMAAGIIVLIQLGYYLIKYLIKKYIKEDKEYKFYD